MRYLARRLGLLLLTGWAALTVNFVLPRLMPGDPIQVMFARFQGRLNPAAANALKIAFGLKTNQSIFAQYFTYLGHTLTGRLGFSLTYFPEKVTTLIGQALPWTLGLVGFATVVAFIVGTAMGALAAWHRGSALDSIMVPTGVMLSAMPVFWIGLLVLYVFAFKLGWFPVGGGATGGQGLASVSGFGAIISHAALPAITLTAVSLGGYIILMRNTTITVLNDDFVKFARAKGLPDRVVASRYAARNAILPNFTSFALALGFVVAGAIFIEYVFDYPGIAYLLYQAVTSLDYPLMQGIFLVIVLGVLIANFLADLLYVLLDPRIRVEARS
ncbi:MAG: ABC transporter permease [Actinomycetota bacterium]|jgi:peptide/nickel transport system permease protein|nr:ABC transporter permease [Actinomycetota bacterium]